MNVIITTNLVVYFFTPPSLLHPSIHYFFIYFIPVPTKKASMGMYSGCGYPTNDEDGYYVYLNWRRFSGKGRHALHLTREFSCAN